MMSGGPPPPPPPTLGGPPPPPPNLGGGGPKIGNRGGGNDRGALLSQIQGGVSLKKTEGPKEPKLNTTSSSGGGGGSSGGSGGGGGSKSSGDQFSIGALASELAKQRALRVQQKALQGNSYRKSMKLDNLLEELK